MIQTSMKYDDIPPGRIAFLGFKSICTEMSAFTTLKDGSMGALRLNSILISLFNADFRLYWYVSILILCINLTL
jgi:hypothetical protein